jgi:hypothetical protein
MNESRAGHRFSSASDSFDGAENGATADVSDTLEPGLVG